MLTQQGLASIDEGAPFYQRELQLDIWILALGTGKRQEGE